MSIGFDANQNTNAIIDIKLIICANCNPIIHASTRKFMTDPRQGLRGSGVYVSGFVESPTPTKWGRVFTARNGPLSAKGPVEKYFVILYRTS